VLDRYLSTNNRVKTYIHFLKHEIITIVNRYKRKELGLFMPK